MVKEGSILANTTLEHGTQGKKPRWRKSLHRRVPIATPTTGHSGLLWLPATIHATCKRTQLSKQMQLMARILQVHYTDKDEVPTADKA